MHKGDTWKIFQLSPLLANIWNTMDNKPDNIEKGIRFGCGGILGFIVGLYFVIRSYVVSDSVIACILTIVFFIVLFGGMAMKQGDRFWLSLKNWL